MQRTPAIVLLVSLLGALAFHARAGDAEDVSKLAHEFVVDFAELDFDKVEALGRPQDADVAPKPPEDARQQIRSAQNLPQVQEIRRQLADEVAKAVALAPPEFTPDNSCAIVSVTPVDAEVKKFCELMELYMAYVTTAVDDKAQGIPMPKVEDIRARLLTPGSPEQQELDQFVASFSKLKLRLQFEKTAAGWRVNLHVLQAYPPGTP